MAKCNICGKKTRVGRQVSHSGVRTRRIFKPNLHPAWVVKAGKRVRLKLCTKCLRKVRREVPKAPQVLKVGESPVLKSA